MKIQHITAYRMNMALSKPYTITYETVTDVENVFIEVILANGIVGIGAASPSEFVFGETISDTTANLRSDVLQTWIGRDIRQFRQLIFESKSLFPHHSATRTAIDIALHDAFGKYLGQPVVDFYGQKIQSLPTSVTIGIKSVAAALEEAAEYKNLGFRILKVKTGLQLEEDIERCVKLRERFGNYFKIRVDANQGYTAQQTIDFVHATLGLGLELIEQPMPVGSESELKSLPADIRKYIACDESLKDTRSALYLASEPRACGIFNIKLMKCGGLLGAFEIATIAQAADVDLFWGCYDESIVSIAAALHAALACPSTRYLDLDGSLDLAEDLVQGGFLLENGDMRPTKGAGFGFEKLEDV
jgi:L-Ala-D/L-Glu epimerase